MPNEIKTMEERKNKLIKDKNPNWIDLYESILE